MIEALFFFFYALVCALSFVAGFQIGRKKKAITPVRAPSEEEIRSERRIRREYENFMNYTGDPQDVISDD